ncbi:hypothetical protein FGG08_006916 [Glutinoglossum americanum]|uniref:Aldehyde dehydrogenase domain-containing protein n=1 Tax=Glutinoglossum americanum TaxID=1670608 RepID=A0A9P8I0C8_9PEZI|nr:hypothetical protein FGG08_006916 [Glutinoglossum americanum]
MPRPLAIYIFSSNQKEIDEVLENTISGGVTVNDIAMHCAVPNAPFGGVGESGHGNYHSKYGFLSFTHLRTVLSPPNWLDKLMGFRYPPYHMSNLSKITVTNRLGFKKGETMQDQKTKTKSKGWDVVVMAVKFAVLAVALAAVDSRMGGNPRLLEVLMSTVRTLRAKAKV